jgi:hypothetical protein
MYTFERPLRSRDNYLQFSPLSHIVGSIRQFISHFVLNDMILNYLGLFHIVAFSVRRNLVDLRFLRS